jgi:hypothetical protein
MKYLPEVLAERVNGARGGTEKRGLSALLGRALTL